MRGKICSHNTLEAVESCPNHKSTQKLMTDGPITRQLLSYMLPILLSQLLQQLYTMADAAILGRCIGARALAAHSSAGLLLNLIVNFFIGLSAGMSIIIAHLYGHRDFDELKKAIKTCITLSLLAGGAFTAIGLLGTDTFLGYMQTPSDILPLAHAYLAICFWGMVPQLVYNVAAAVLRALGNTRSPLIYLLGSAALNVALNALFVIVLDMGITGAALSTLISQSAAAAMTIVKLFTIEPEFRLDGLAIHRLYLRESVVKGLPSGLQAVFMSISSLVLQTFINSFGYAAMAGICVYAKVEGFLYYPLFAFGLALTTFISQNDGAGRQDRVRQGMKLGLKLVLGGTVALTIILLLTSRYTVRLFTDDEAVIANALEAIYWNFPFYFLYAVNQVYIGTIRGVGNTAFPMFTSLCSYCVFRVLWCALLMPRFHTMRIVYTAYDASWIVMIALLLWGVRRYVRGREPQLRPSAARSHA